MTQDMYNKLKNISQLNLKKSKIFEEDIYMFLVIIEDYLEKQDIKNDYELNDIEYLRHYISEMFGTYCKNVDMLGGIICNQVYNMKHENDSRHYAGAFLCEFSRMKHNEAHDYKYSLYHETLTKLDYYLK